MDILVVDDDADHAEIVASALRSRYPALKVEVARYGADAIEKTLDDEVPSLLLAGTAPGKDARTLGKMIRQAYRRGIKVLLMVNSNAGSMIEQHIDDLLQKPVDLPALYSAIDHWFVKRGKVEKGGDLVHFHGQPKTSRGKHGILIPREMLERAGIEPGEEYDVFLKKVTNGKKERKNG